MVRKIMKGILASLAGMLVMSCGGCGGGGGGGDAPAVNAAAAAPAPPSACYVQNPNAGKPCILDDAAVARGIIHKSDDPRMVNTFKKFAAGGDFTIGFIGGSITQGAYSTDEAHRYVNIVFAYIQKRFPQSTFHLVNAGVGGTDSTYGAQRLQHDLLDYHPDLVITEWANNDGANGAAAVQRDYGDVVDRTMGQPNSPTVVMLMGMDIGGGSNQDMETPVGYARNVTMLSTREAILAQQQRGDFTGEQRTQDPIHPNDLGHEILAQLVIQYFQLVKF